MADFDVFGSTGDGGFTVSGSEAVYLLTAAEGSFSVNQPTTATSFVFTRNLAAAVGSYAVTGTDADFAAFGAYRMVLDPGAFTATGTDVGFTFTRTIGASVGSYTVTGTAATLLQVYPITASVGTFHTAGTAANLKAGRKMVAASGSFAETGTAVSLKKQIPIVCDPGDLSVSGTAVRFDYSAYSEWVVQSKSTAAWAAA